MISCGFFILIHKTKVLESKELEDLNETNYFVSVSYNNVHQ